MAADHIVRFGRDTMGKQLELSEILDPYEKDERGYQPYNPVMMSALIGRMHEDVSALS